MRALWTVQRVYLNLTRAIFRGTHATALGKSVGNDRCSLNVKVAADPARNHTYVGLQ